MGRRWWWWSWWWWWWCACQWWGRCWWWGQWSAGGRDKVSRTLSLLFLSISFRVNRLTASNQKYFSLFYWIAEDTIFWKHQGAEEKYILPCSSLCALFQLISEKISLLPPTDRYLPPRRRNRRSCRQFFDNFRSSDLSKNWVAGDVGKISVQCGAGVRRRLTVWPDFHMNGLGVPAVPLREKNGEGQGVITIAPQPPPATLYNQNLPTLCSFWHIIATFTRYISINPN